MTDIGMLSAAFSMLNEPIAVSRSGRIIYMNPSAVLLVGEDLSSKPLASLMPPHIANNQAANFMTTAVINGKSCTVKVTTGDDMKVYAMIHSEHSINPSVAVLTSLGTSMTNIRFSATCMSELAEELGNEKMQEYIWTLNRNYYRIKRTLDNFYTLSAIEAGTIPFQPQPIDVTDFCGSLVDTVEILGKPHNFDISFKSESHLRIVADRALLRQLVLNLISNSIVYGKRGGRTTLSLLRTGNSLIIGTDDDGIGIPPEELPLVFDRYKHPECLTRPGGAGIGLAVVRSIAELHNGTLVIESRGAGAGTSVRVMLSYDIAPDKSLNSPALRYADDDMQQILTGLSPCLPLDCYSEKFMD